MAARAPEINPIIPYMIGKKIIAPTPSRTPAAGIPCVAADVLPKIAMKTPPINPKIAIIIACNFAKDRGSIRFSLAIVVKIILDSLINIAESECFVLFRFSAELEEYFSTFIT